MLVNPLERENCFSRLTLMKSSTDAGAWDRAALAECEVCRIKNPNLKKYQPFARIVPEEAAMSNGYFFSRTKSMRNNFMAGNNAHPVASVALVSKVVALAPPPLC